MILTQILHKKRIDIEQAKEDLPLKELLKRLDSRRRPRSFKNALSGRHKLSLIAEIKKSSPSAGVLKEDFDPVKIAEIYELNGARAISVLTEKNFFSGDISFINSIREVVHLPVLRKDFIIDEYQLYESAAFGADAVLLIAGILSPEELKRFLAICSRLSIDALVEVHTEGDLEKVLETQASIIGINNRNLHSFEVDLDITSRLKLMIPKGRVLVSESGLKSREDIMFIKSLDIDAVLVGEVFLRAEDIGAKVREFTTL